MHEGFFIRVSSPPLIACTGLAIHESPRRFPRKGTEPGKSTGSCFQTIPPQAAKTYKCRAPGQTTEKKQIVYHVAVPFPLSRELGLPAFSIFIAEAWTEGERDIGPAGRPALQVAGPQTMDMGCLFFVGTFFWGGLKEI